MRILRLVGAMVFRLSASASAAPARAEDPVKPTVFWHTGGLAALR
jgi:hypothetical protein